MEGSEEAAAETAEATAQTGIKNQGLKEFCEHLEAAGQAARRAMMEKSIETYASRAQERVAGLREAHPDWESAELADFLTRDAATNAAAVGAAVAAPGIIVGPGTAVSVALAAPEVAWLFREQVKLTLDVATVYGRDPADREARMAEMEDFFPSAREAVKRGICIPQIVISALARTGWRRAALLLAPVLGAAAMAGLAIGRTAFGRKLPLLGIPISALVNLNVLAATGRAARARYDQVAITIAEETGAEDEGEVSAEEPIVEDVEGIAEEPAAAAGGTPDASGEAPKAGRARTQKTEEGEAEG